MGLLARIRAALSSRPLSADRDDALAERAARVGGTAGGMGAVFHGGDHRREDDFLAPSEERLQQPD
jgi:hypothetical protein